VHFSLADALHRLATEDGGSQEYTPSLASGVQTGERRFDFYFSRFFSRAGTKRIGFNFLNRLTVRSSPCRFQSLVADLLFLLLTHNYIDAADQCARHTFDYAFLSSPSRTYVCGPKECVEATGGGTVFHSFAVDMLFSALPHHPGRGLRPSPRA
jgi:hypothetical protein